MDFANLIQNINYSWTEPRTYLVLVPGLSLIIQKVQLVNVLPIEGANAQEVDAKSRQFANICKWHLRGSLIQLTASIIAIKIFALPVFLLLAGIATCELLDILIQSLRNSITIYEFYPNGAVKSRTSVSACNIF